MNIIAVVNSNNLRLLILAFGTSLISGCRSSIEISKKMSGKNIIVVEDKHATDSIDVYFPLLYAINNSTFDEVFLDNFTFKVRGKHLEFPNLVLDDEVIKTRYDIQKRRISAKSSAIYIFYHKKKFAKTYLPDAEFKNSIVNGFNFHRRLLEISPSDVLFKKYKNDILQDSVSFVFRSGDEVIVMTGQVGEETFKTITESQSKNP